MMPLEQLRRAGTELTNPDATVGRVLSSPHYVKPVDHL
jgi:hypothetical protein